MQYPIAIFYKDKNYHVTVPDIPDLNITGENMADAVSNARMMVIGHLHQLIENDKKIPNPTPISDHLKKPEYLGYTWAIVSVELARIMGESIELNLQISVKLFKQLTQKYPDVSMEHIVITALKQQLQNQ
ncbi:phage protein [Moraxella macacae 0408225]|uniref:Phage protein n=1 Tax=Moraxella macacae 0408225 TaxID=1230338 RepID=L2F649_9GAMM|nr:type II toxin-antitoxin system HicB family antitoxin [Moraxella macacae]ELA08256.1 phage protein [Moraxella macacae 0408225]